MKRLALAGTVIVSVLVATLVGQAQTRTQRRSSRRSAAAKPNIETEASKEARKLADQMVTKCDDDSYRGYLDGHLVVWKGYHLITQPQRVTPADTLNGIESSFVVRINFDAKWVANHWVDNLDNICLTLTKKNGAWQPYACSLYLQEFYGGVPPAHKPDCASVLQ